MNPSVTAVVPTRDRPELLRRAVRSILDQDYDGDVHCLIVFDGGDPVPVEVPTSQRRSLRMLTNLRTPGLAGARNTGILEADGDLVAFCDDDDEWMPDKLRAQVRELEAEPQAEIVGSGIEVRYEGRPGVVRIPPAPRIGMEVLVRSRVTELHPSTFLIRRDALLDGLGLVDEELPGSYSEDYDLLLRAARRGTVLAVMSPLVRVHWHASSYFAARWQTIYSALRYLLERHPEFSSDRRGLARVTGQIAFACVGAGRRRDGRAWAIRTLRLNLAEKRAWLALVVSLRILSAETVLRAANRRGRGI